MFFGRWRWMSGTVVSLGGGLGGISALVVCLFVGTTPGVTTRVVYAAEEASPPVVAPPAANAPATVSPTTVSPVAPLMKLFLSGRLPPARQGAVVEMICTRGNAEDLQVIFDRAAQTDGFSPELRQQTLGWLATAATTRKVKPSGDLSHLTNLVSADDAALQQAAVELAGAWQVASVTPALEQLVLSEHSTGDLQTAALGALVAIGDASVQPLLLKLAAPDRPLPQRMQAVAGLAALDLTAAAQAAAQLLSQAPADLEPGVLLDAFFQRKEGADLLAAALQQQTLSVDVAKVLLRTMYSVGRNDAALSDVLSLAAGVAADPTPPTAEEVARLADDVMRHGDPVRGEAIFRRKELSCLNCHGIGRAGGQVGPDLSAVGGTSPTDYIVNSIVNPNLAVKELYVTRVFALVSGNVVTGVVVDRNDDRVLARDAQGRVQTIPTADIEEEIAGPSLMPSGLTKFLTRDELVDLARFVSELGKPGPYEIPKIPSVRRWKLLANPPAELTDAVPHLEHIRQFVLGSDPAQWSSVYARVDGTLPLSELRRGEAPVTLILQGELLVNTPGEVQLQIESSEPVQVWVDAEQLPASTLTPSATGMVSAPLSLTEGRHTITVRSAVSGNPQPTLRVLIDRPADSKVLFEVVGGA